MGSSNKAKRLAHLDALHEKRAKKRHDAIIETTRRRLPARHPTQKASSRFTFPFATASPTGTVTTS